MMTSLSYNLTISSLVPRPFIGEIAMELTRVQTVYRCDITEITAQPVQAMNMHVIFDHSYVTVRNVQPRCCSQQD